MFAACARRGGDASSRAESESGPPSRRATPRAVSGVEAAPVPPPALTMDPPREDDADPWDHHPHPAGPLPAAQAMVREERRRDAEAEAAPGPEAAPGRQTMRFEERREEDDAAPPPTFSTRASAPGDPGPNGEKCGA